MPQLDGKVIITTGGTQGVGEAIAIHAAQNGAAGVVLCGRQEEKGKAVAAKVKQLGADAEYVRTEI